MTTIQGTQPGAAGAARFESRIAVRAYELDSMGHVNRTVYLQYAEHARWACLREAGIDHDQLLATGAGPVTLEERIRFHRELRAGDEVVVSCAFIWGQGKTTRIEQDFHRADGTLAAELTSVVGLLDLQERRLVPDPGALLRSLATAPGLLGLGATPKGGAE
jgi:acyl-CoA thioester hydrolase